METVWTPLAATGACVNLALFLTPHLPHAYVSHTIYNFLSKFLSLVTSSLSYKTKTSPSAELDWAKVSCEKNLMHYICMLVFDMQIYSYKSFPVWVWYFLLLNDFVQTWEICFIISPCYLFQSTSIARAARNAAKAKVCLMLCRSIQCMNDSMVL